MLQLLLLALYNIDPIFISIICRRRVSKLLIFFKVIEAKFERDTKYQLKFSFPKFTIKAYYYYVSKNKDKVGLTKTNPRIIAKDKDKDRDRDRNRDRYARQRQRH